VGSRCPPGTWITALPAGVRLVPPKEPVEVEERAEIGTVGALLELDRTSLSAISRMNWETELPLDWALGESRPLPPA